MYMYVFLYCKCMWETSEFCLELKCVKIYGSYIMLGTLCESSDDMEYKDLLQDKLKTL